MIFYIASFGLVIIGLYIILTQKNLLKIILGLNILDTGVNLFLVAIGYIEGGSAPIFTADFSGKMVDPIPQALVLTAIVIGVAILGLALAMTIKFYKQHGTLDIKGVRNLKW